MAGTNPVNSNTSSHPHVGESAQRKAISGLMDAMKRKVANANSPTPSRVTAGSLVGLDPIHFSPSSAFTTSTEDDEVAKTPQRNHAFPLSNALKRKASSPLIKTTEAPKSPKPAPSKLSRKVLFPAERTSKNILTQKRWLQKNQPKFSISGLQHGAPNRKHTFTAPLVHAGLDTMSVEDRKRFFIYTPTPAMQACMQAHVAEIHKMFPVTRKINDCMLHPNPKGLLKTGNYNQVITCKYVWRDESKENHSIGINYGITSLLINSTLSSTRKEGFINAAWHLSHLCGNWICCNWRHHTVEPGPVNIGRNACFASPTPCLHNPPCMKDKKIVVNLPTIAPAKTGGVAGMIGTSGGADLSMEVEEEDEGEEGDGMTEERKDVGGLKHIDTDSSAESGEEEDEESSEDEEDA